MEYIDIVLRCLLLIVPLLIAVAYLTLLERKVMGGIQRRKGPNIVGIYGILQPFADALKLVVKEIVIPVNANKIIYIVAPMVTLIVSIIGWGVVPLDRGLIIGDIGIGILYVLGVSSLGVYGIICSGWASNSKYAFLGALRSAAQMISYEVSIGLILIGVILCASSLSIQVIIDKQTGIWYMYPLWSMLLMYSISILAETNRPPFDLPEAEAEIVAGYNVEYSGMGFVYFFIGEYANIVIMSMLLVVLFIGGKDYNIAGLEVLSRDYSIIIGLIVLGLKLCIVLIWFIWVRAAFPRYRYDQLMRIGWKAFLPMSLGWVIIVSSIVK